MIAAYIGKGWLSEAIRHWHRAEYSHVSEISEDMKLEIEAWKGGVRAVAPFSGHAKGTIVHLFDYKTPLTNSQYVRLFDLLHGQVGKPYDYAGVLAFITQREDAGEGQDKWFCGELLQWAHSQIERPLLERIEPHKAFPSILTYSTELKFIRSVTC